MSKYPDIRAGADINGPLLLSMLPEIIVKPATTARASTTTPTIDPDLQVQLEANATYFIEFHLMPAATSAADWKATWTVPSGAAGLRSVMAPSTVASNGDADNITMRAGTHLFSTEVHINGVRNGNALAFYHHEWGVVRTTTGGTCGINWSQITSNATATQLFADSVMIVRRVA